MLSLIKPIIQKVNQIQLEEQKSALLVFANIVFLVVLLTFTVSLILISFNY